MLVVRVVRVCAVIVGCWWPGSSVPQGTHRLLGIFNVGTESAAAGGEVSVPEGVEDGSYHNEIGGQWVRVENGKTSIPEIATIFSVIFHKKPQIHPSLFLGFEDYH